MPCPINGSTCAVYVERRHPQGFLCEDNAQRFINLSQILELADGSHGQQLNCCTSRKEGYRSVLGHHLKRAGRYLVRSMSIGRIVRTNRNADGTCIQEYDGNCSVDEDRWYP